jgi:hypothetical protein
LATPSEKKQMLSMQVSIPSPGSLHSVDLSREEDFENFSEKLQHGWTRFDRDPDAHLSPILSFCKRVTDSGLPRAVVNRRALGFWMPESNRIYLKLKLFAKALRRSRSSISGVFHANRFIPGKMSTYKSEFISGLGDNEIIRFWSVRITNAETTAGNGMAEAPTDNHPELQHQQEQTLSDCYIASPNEWPSEDDRQWF